MDGSGYAIVEGTLECSGNYCSPYLQSKFTGIFLKTNLATSGLLQQPTTAIKLLIQANLIDLQKRTYSKPSYWDLPNQGTAR